jgi:HSP20 family molecular chaperone IbpA
VKAVRERLQKAKAKAAPRPKATYHDGVLELTVPMPKEVELKQVKIQVEGERRS